MAIGDFCSCILSAAVAVFGSCRFLAVVVLKRISIYRILKPVVSLPVFVGVPRPSLDAGDILCSGCPSVFLSVWSSWKLVNRMFYKNAWWNFARFRIRCTWGQMWTDYILKAKDQIWSKYQMEAYTLMLSHQLLSSFSVNLLSYCYSSVGNFYFSVFPSCLLKNKKFLYLHDPLQKQNRVTGVLWSGCSRPTGGQRPVARWNFRHAESSTVYCRSSAEEPRYEQLESTQRV